MPKTSDVDRLVTDLRRLVGARSARKLAPRFAQAAAAYKESASETITQTKQRREEAKKRIAALKAADRRFGRLLEQLNEVTAMIPRATGASRPATAASGPIGQLAGDAVRMVWEVDAWRDTVRVWQETARLDMRGRPGRKVGDRRLLNEWVVLQLAREGISVTTNPDGITAKVLQIVYRAAGFDGPQDLYRDLRYALNATARERKHLH